MHLCKSGYIPWIFRAIVVETFIKLLPKRRLLIDIEYMPVSSTSVLVILNTVLESTRACLEDDEITLDLGSIQTISLATIDRFEEK